MNNRLEQIAVTADNQEIKLKAAPANLLKSKSFETFEHQNLAHKRDAAGTLKNEDLA